MTDEKQIPQSKVLLKRSKLLLLNEDATAKIKEHMERDADYDESFHWDDRKPLAECVAFFLEQNYRPTLENKNQGKCSALLKELRSIKKSEENNFDIVYGILEKEQYDPEPIEEDNYENALALIDHFMQKKYTGQRYEYRASAVDPRVREKNVLSEEKPKEPPSPKWQPDLARLKEKELIDADLRSKSRVGTGALDIYKMFITDYHQAQEQRRRARLETDSLFFPREVLQEAKEIEEKYVKKISDLREKSPEIMTNALQEMSITYFKTKAMTLLMNGSAIAVKNLSNPIDGDLLKVFEKRFPIKPSDHRDIGEYDSNIIQNVVYEPDLNRAVIRPVENKKTIKENNIFSHKESFTVIGIPTADVTLFKSHTYENTFSLLIDPAETYLSPRFSFPSDAYTKLKWWLGNATSFGIQGDVPHRLKCKVETAAIDQLIETQKMDMKQGRSSEQNEIMPKVPLKAVLGVMVLKEDSNDEEQILTNRLSAIHANYVWRYYCYTRYPELTRLWKHFPIFLHRPVLGKVDISSAYQEKNLGIVPYSLEDQIKDLTKAKEMNNVTLNQWILEIQAITETCGPKLYPIGIMRTLDSLCKPGNDEASKDDSPQMSM